MQISQSQIEQVNKQIQALVNAKSFYGKKLAGAGITGISSAEDFESLPFSEKADLRDAYPLGLMTAPEDKIVRIHSSSGTTGLPVIIPYTRKDVDDWGRQASDSRPAARSSAQWRSLSVPAIPKNSFR